MQYWFFILLFVVSTTATTTTEIIPTTAIGPYTIIEPTEKNIIPTTLASTTPASQQTTIEPTEKDNLVSITVATPTLEEKDTPAPPQTEKDNTPEKDTPAPPQTEKDNTQERDTLAPPLSSSPPPPPSSSPQPPPVIDERRSIPSPKIENILNKLAIDLNNNKELIMIKKNNVDNNQVLTMLAANVDDIKLSQMNLSSIVAKIIETVEKKNIQPIAINCTRLVCENNFAQKIDTVLKEKIFSVLKNATTKMNVSLMLATALHLEFESFNIAQTINDIFQYNSSATAPFDTLKATTTFISSVNDNILLQHITSEPYEWLKGMFTTLVSGTILGILAAVGYKVKQRTNRNLQFVT